MKYDKKYFEQVYDASGEGREIAEARARILLKLKPGIKRVLDVGCGFGDFLRFLEDEGVGVSGVDIAPHALKEARKRVSGRLYRVDVVSERLPYKDEWFDAVAIIDVIEHIFSSEKILSEAYRVLRKGGLVFITTPNNQGKIGDLVKRIFPEDPTHINVQGKGYWLKRLVEAGFVEAKAVGCILHGFPPLYKFRQLLERVKIPVIRRPLFFPITAFCGTLYLVGWKEPEGLSNINF